MVKQPNQPTVARVRSVIIELYSPSLDTITGPQLSARTMQIYYINLAARTDRKSEMEARFEHCGLNAIRIEAVTPEHISANEINKYCQPLNCNWLTPPELACSLSHVAALRQFLSSKENSP